MPDLSLENASGRSAGKIICGVDEVGRGPLAGPVVAAAVILPATIPELLLAEINDSKKLTAKKREQLFPHVQECCIWAMAASSVAEIDELNILHASLLAMRRAVEGLNTHIDLALIDGNKIPELSCKAIPIVKGDTKSLSIAAASILAKVTRDRLMLKLHREFPYYGWDKNAGYPTAFHRAALKAHGLTPHHRRSFAPVRELLSDN
jgi:ribonuclease HII